MNNKIPFTSDDLYLHLKITELDATPDGDEVACTVRSVSRDDDSYQYAVCTFPLDDRPPMQLTQGTGGTDNTPHWSPDGTTLAFMSNRNGTPQVHTLPRRGGEAVLVGNFEGGHRIFDGRRTASPWWSPQA